MNEGKSFGMSLAASVLLVVKEEGAATSSGQLTFQMGDVEMTDVEDEQDDE